MAWRRRRHCSLPPAALWDSAPYLYSCNLPLPVIEFEALTTAEQASAKPACETGGGVRDEPVSRD